jgi:hypothetical protein
MSSLPSSSQPKRPSTSAYEQLQRLPAVFTLNTLVRWSGLSRGSAKVALSRWGDRGMVESAGPRSAIYFNRVVDPRGEQSDAIKALVIKYPSATLCGASVLHSAGWTTQIPSTVHVAIERRDSYAQISGISLHPRSIHWFRAMERQKAWYDESVVPVADQIANTEMATFGLRALRPGWALAELWSTDDAWHPEVDDLDIDAQFFPEIIDACKALAVQPPHWLQHAEPGDLSREPSRRDQMRL